MYKKIAAAAMAVTVAALLAACDSRRNAVGNSGSAVSGASSVGASSAASVPGAESLTSEAVMELESVPGLDTDSIAAQSQAMESAAESEMASAESDTENTDVNNETDTENITPTSIDVGGLTLSASEIPFDKTVTLSGGYSSDAVIYGDTMYLLDGKKLRTFTVGDSAEETDTINLSGSYSRVDSDPYGQIYLSRDKFDCAVVDENGQLQTIDTTGIVSMSKLRDFGISANNGKITRFTDEESGQWSSLTEKNSDFPDNVSAVEFSGDHILIAHSSGDNSEVTVCSYEGEPQFTTDGGSVGEDITAVTETAGVIAASSCGDLCLWNESGELIGRLGSDDTAALLGEEQPVTIKRLFAGEPGEIIAFCAGSEKKSEAHLYRITGF